MEFQKDTNLQRKTKSANKKIVLLKKQQLVVSSSSVSSRSSIRSIPSLKSSRQTRILRNVQSKLQLEPNVAKTPSSQSCDHHKSDIKIHEKSTLPANVRTRTQTQATSKSEPQVRGLEELTRCSSVNNLGTDSKSKGAFSKLRKSASKDKLDKLTDTKNVKELSNNNKLNPAEGEETLEVGILQKQLNKMAKEKSDLMLELDDHKEELKVLKDEIVKLRLLEGEHATDSPECDNVSEVSVTCLQDKINKMQETNYSTNEELQATLQELSDLQSQLTELQQSNERLLDEKNLMFESLCRQTERLNDARAEVESVKQLLCREKEEGNADREKKLITLLKSTQAERETLLFKREQLSNELLEVHATNLEQDAQLEQLNERVRTMESALDAKNAEYKLLNQDLMVAKDLCSARQIEINRLTDLLENARTKINELEQERALNDKSELDELLHSVRKEKCELESEVSNLKEEIAWSINEGDKLREQLSVLQEEYTVTQKNAKCTLSEFEYKYEKLMAEKSKIKEQLLQLQEVVNELQVQNQCLLESKRQLSNDLSDIQRKNNELQVEIDHLKKIRNDETEEWLAFQNDLLTSVKVANDIKSEVQQQLQETIAENISHYNRIQELENQIDRLKENETLLGNLATDDIPISKQKMMNQHNSRQSVKSLIETIENAGKTITKSDLTGSRSSSITSLNSITPETKPKISYSSNLSPESPLLSLEWCEPKVPLREQQPNKQSCDWSKTIINDALKDKKLSKEDKILQVIDKDPLKALVTNGGSKRNALLKWCQNKTVGYRNIDITNFSSSWNDGLALCAILHTYLPDQIPYDTLLPQENHRNFALAFSAAESVGISTTLNITDMVQHERPNWQQVMAYVTAIYKHFET